MTYKKIHHKNGRSALTGAKNPAAKLTTHEIDLIRDLRAAGTSTADLAKLFEVSPQHIRNVVACRYRVTG